jgi:hypothetical protein
MDTLKDRYFIRLNHKNSGGTPTRLPLTNKRLVFRAFIQFLTGDFASIEIFNEEWMDKKVFNKERKNGVLVRGDGVSMREKLLGSDCWDKMTNQFREGLYDPIENGEYKGEGQRVAYFDDDQFEDSIELLTLIHEGEY